MGHYSKKLMLEELSGYFKKSAGFIVTNFSNLEVIEIDALRRALEKKSSKLIVAKNTLLKLALSQLKMEQAAQLIEGTTGIALYQDDPVAVAKTLFDFSKGHESFKIKASVVDGELLNEKKTKELSQLPSKDILRATVLMRMKSPIVGFVNVLSGPMRGLVVVLDKISKQIK